MQPTTTRIITVDSNFNKFLELRENDTYKSELKVALEAIKKLVQQLQNPYKTVLICQDVNREMEYEKFWAQDLRKHFLKLEWLTHDFETIFNRNRPIDVFGEYLNGRNCPDNVVVFGTKSLDEKIQRKENWQERDVWTAAVIGAAKTNKIVYPIFLSGSNQHFWPPFNGLTDGAIPEGTQFPKPPSAAEAYHTVLFGIIRRNYDNDLLRKR